MTSILLDTSAYARFKRNFLPAVSAIQAAQKIIVPSIVLGELAYGFELGSRKEQNWEELYLFLATSRVEVMDVSQESAEFYANIFAYLRRQGKPIPTNDVWIAALAMQSGTTLVTADQHFSFLPQIMTKLLA